MDFGVGLADPGADGLGLLLSLGRLQCLEQFSPLPVTVFAGEVVDQLLGALRDFSSAIVGKFVAADDTGEDVNAGTPGSVYANLSWTQPHAELPERFNVRHRWQGSLSGESFQGLGSHVIDPKSSSNSEGGPTLHDCRLTRTVTGDRTEIHLVDVEQFEFSPAIHEEWAVFEGDKVSYRSKSR